MSGVALVACHGFLVREAYVCALMSGAGLFSLKCNEVSSSEFWGVLSVFWQFVGFSLLWRFLTVCGFVQVACQGFLVREACVSVLVGGAVLLLSGVK